MKKLITTLIYCACVYAVQAQAVHLTTTDLGVLSTPGQIENHFQSYGAGATFTDLYNFSVGAGVPSVGTAATNIKVGNILDLSSLTFSIYSGHDHSGSLLLSGATEYVGIAPGDYSALVSGTATGNAGGSYVITLAAVPLPASVVLLASGLIGLVGVSARRRRAL